MGLFEIVVDGVGDLIVFMRHDMLIDLFGHGGGGVAHAGHDVFVGDAEGAEDGIVVVAEGVEVEGQAEAGGEALEAAGDGVRRQGDDQRRRAG